MSRATVSGRIHRTGELVTVVAVAVAVLTVSLPQFLSSVTFAPVSAAVDRFRSGESLTPRHVDRLVERARASIETSDRVEYWRALGQLRYLDFGSARLGGNRSRAALQAAEEATVAALARSPADTGAWYLLALIRHYGNRPGTMPEALEMSILTGRMARHLMVPRLRLGLRAEIAEGDDPAALLRDQMALAWRFQREAVVTALASGAVPVGAVRRLFAQGHDDLLRELEQAVDELD